MQRQQTRAQSQARYGKLQNESDEDLEDRTPNGDAEHSEESKDTSGSSVDPKQECRLILLGGDEQSQRDASNFILRTEGIQETTNRVYGSCVEGRHVSVVNTPAAWLDHLASFLFYYRKLDAIRNEVQSCISPVFPGPHAFLLVLQAVRGTGKWRYLLKGIKHVFGKEALGYTLVLFVMPEGSNSERAARNSNVRRCGGRYHFLENTDQSVQELFQKIKNMTDSKHSKFFIPSSYENYMELYFESWERKRFCHLNKLCKELEEMKVTIQDLNEKMEDNTKEQAKCENTSGDNESKLRKELDDSQQREQELRNKLDDSQQQASELRKKLNDSQQRERELRKELDDSQQQESELRIKLNDSQQRESELRKGLDGSKQMERIIKKGQDDSRQTENKLREELEDSQQTENKLRKDLEVSQQTENKLRKDLEDSQQRESKLRKELESSRQQESKLKKKLDYSQRREDELRRKLDDSQERERDLRKQLDGASK